MAPKTAAAIHVDSLGDHHQASLLISPEEGTVIGGAVLNYSDHGVVGMHISRDGTAKGTFTHSGDTHYLKGQFDSQGQFRGTYVDKRAGVGVTLAGGAAQLTRGQLPEVGLTVEGDHHTTQLALDANGQLSGVLESRMTDASAFRVEMRNGKIAGGGFTHRGQHHRTSITLTENSWQAELASDDDDLQWSIGVENGAAGTRGTVNFKRDF